MTDPTNKQPPPTFKEVDSLVKRLRDPYKHQDPICREAAAMIERLYAALGTIRMQGAPVPQVIAMLREDMEIAVTALLRIRALDTIDLRDPDRIQEEASMRFVEAQIVSNIALRDLGHLPQVKASDLKLS